MPSCWVRGILLGAGLLALNTGCTTLLKQGYYEARGARGEVQPNMELAADALASYRSVEFKPAHTFLSEQLCPRKTLNRYDEYAREAERAMNPELGDATPTLVVDTEIFHVRVKDLLKAAQFLARLRMYDGDLLVVDAILNVQSQSFREGDERDLAKAAFKSIRKFIHTYRGTPAESDSSDDEDEETEAESEPDEEEDAE